MREAGDIRDEIKRSWANQGNEFEEGGFTRKICREVLEADILLNPGDAFVLFTHVRGIPEEGTYLEIGCARGGSLTCADLAAKSVGKSIRLIGIDPDPTIPPFCGVINRLPNLIFHMLKSENCVGLIEEGSIDLIFVDGDHRRKAVRGDVFNYLKKLKPKGIMIGDNWNGAGVKQGVKDVVEDDYEVIENSNFFRIKKGGLNASSNISGRSGRKVASLNPSES